MKEDPFIANRREQVSNHRSLGSVDISNNKQEVVALKNLENPQLVGHIEDFGWSEKSVDNIIEAVKRGWISIEELPDDQIKIEFLPITDLDQQLGHITELAVLKKNLERTDGIYGDPDSKKLAYLQTTEFLVEGYIDDSSEGERYARLYVDVNALLRYRDLYLDPESIHITDYEFGRAFAVYGGIPFIVIGKAEIMQARKVPYTVAGEGEDFTEDADEYMRRQTERLREFIGSLRSEAKKDKA